MDVEDSPSTGAVELARLHMMLVGKVYPTSTGKYRDCYHRVCHCDDSPSYPNALFPHKPGHPCGRLTPHPIPCISAFRSAVFLPRCTCHLLLLQLPPVSSGYSFEPPSPPARLSLSSRIINPQSLFRLKNTSSFLYRVFLPCVFFQVFCLPLSPPAEHPTSSKPRPRARGRAFVHVTHRSVECLVDLLGTFGEESRSP